MLHHADCSKQIMGILILSVLLFFPYSWRKNTHNISLHHVAYSIFDIGYTHVYYDYVPDGRGSRKEEKWETTESWMAFSLGNYNSHTYITIILVKHSQ